MTDFQREMQQITSTKGWARVSYDTHLWIPCLRGLPEGWDPPRWAREFAEAWWGFSGLPYDHSDLEKLTVLLGYIYESTWGRQSRIPCHLVFIHLPDPRVQPLPVYLSIFKALGPRDEQLRSLARVHDPAAVKPPVVEAFSTPNLGPGLRVLRYVRGEDEGEVDAGLSYAWRSDTYETDLRLFAGTFDLARLQRAMPDIDELARQITVIPGET